MTKKRIVYTEPADYFPKEIRKKYGLGEFSEAAQTAKIEKPKRSKAPKKQV